MQVTRRIKDTAISDAGIQILLPVFFIYLFSPAIAWVWRQALTVDNVFHIAGALVFAVTVCYGFWRGHFELPQRFCWRGWPFVTFIVACLVFLINEAYTGIHIFSAAALIMAVYGYVGFYCRPLLWRTWLVPSGLLLLLLPFEGYLDIYLGFPLRLYCAKIAGDILALLKMGGLSAEAILVAENKAAIVDIDCSGLKGLWAGLIFYLIITWIERKTISLGWFVGLAVFCGSLVTFNILRIVVLVVVDLVWGMPDIAARLHVALGLLGFVISCMLAWLLVRRLAASSQADRENNQEYEDRNEPTRRYCGFASVAAVLLMGILMYQPLAKSETDAQPFEIALPATLSPHRLALSAQEDEFFNRNSATAVKYGFKLDEMQGSLILVSSSYWKAHHDPRNCYRSQGIAVDVEETWRIVPGKNVKYLGLNGGAQSAVYWFQSNKNYTADFSARVFSALKDNAERWLMVSIHFNHPVDVENARRVQQVLEPALEAALNTDKKKSI